MSSAVSIGFVWVFRAFVPSLRRVVGIVILGWNTIWGYQRRERILGGITQDLGDQTTKGEEGYWSRGHHLSHLGGGLIS